MPTAMKDGYGSATACILDAIDDLIANGFTVKFPLSVELPKVYVKPTSAPFVVVLEAGVTVDPLAETQPWRIAFQVIDSATCNVLTGSPATLPDSGALPYTIQFDPVSGTNKFYSPRGLMGEENRVSAWVRGATAAEYNECVTWRIGATIRGSQLDVSHPRYAPAAGSNLSVTKTLTTSYSGAYSEANVAYHAKVAAGADALELATKTGGIFKSIVSVVATGVANGSTVNITVTSYVALMDQGYPFDASMISAKTFGYCSNRGILRVYRPFASMPAVQPDYRPKSGLFPVTLKELDRSESGLNEQGFINRSYRTWVAKMESIAEEPPEPYDEILGEEGLTTKPAYPGTLNDLGPSFPLAYKIVTTPRGLFFAVWEGAASDFSGKYYSWLLIQRPVYAKTENGRTAGQVVTEGQAPVFCVNSVGNVIRRFVVREVDRTDPSASVSATTNTKDNAAIMNDKEQVSVAEGNKYVLAFPARLNTARCAYTYELDMIATASATVVTGNATVPTSVYGEGTAREYLGMFANKEGNNGMRICVISEGGGV